MSGASDERMVQYSTRRFHCLYTQCGMEFHEPRDKTQSKERNNRLNHLIVWVFFQCWFDVLFLVIRNDVTKKFDGEGIIDEK